MKTNVLTDLEKMMLIENMRKHRDLVFPGWGGIGRFAKAVGVSQQLMSRWLGGKNAPPATRLPAIARALGVDEEELRGRWKAEAEAPAGSGEIIQGQIAAIDAQILLLRHTRRALLGKTDPKRYKEGIRIIGEMLKAELRDQ